MAISCPLFPKRGICPTPKRICAQQKSAVASHLAVQHFKMKNVILFMWIRVVCSLSLPLWLCLYLSHQPPPSFSSLPSLQPSLRTSFPSAFSRPLRGCTVRTSARVQINFNLLIPFEKRVRRRLRRRRRREIKEASQVAVWVSNCGGPKCDLQMWNSPLDEILTRLQEMREREREKEVGDGGTAAQHAAVHGVMWKNVGMKWNSLVWRGENDNEPYSCVSMLTHGRVKTPERSPKV